MNLEFKKIKLVKVKEGYGLTIAYNKTDPDKSGVSGEEEHKGLVHPDLKNEIKGLAGHFGILLGLINEADVQDLSNVPAELTRCLEVTGIHLGGSENNPNIVISGTLSTPRGKSAAINTPVEFMESDASTLYVGMADVKERVKRILIEVNEYIRGAKRGMPEEDPNQLKMELPDPGEKVTPEGNMAGSATSHQYANKDAMERVAEMGQDKGKAKSGGKKKVVQSADHPSGEAPE